VQFQRIAADDLGPLQSQRENKGVIHLDKPRIRQLCDGHEHRARAKRGAEPRLALAEAQLALAQPGLRLFALGDVIDDRLDDLASAPFDPGENDFEWHLLTPRVQPDPLKTRAALFHALGNMAVSGRLGTFAIGLKRRRSILGMFSERSEEHTSELQS